MIVNSSKVVVVTVRERSRSAPLTADLHNGSRLGATGVRRTSG
jgi:hypothetical protein